MVRSWNAMRSLGVALSAAVVQVCAAAPAQAQRPTASFEWQKHEAGVTYGVPRVGNHWGACDPTNPKNRRQRCSVLVERAGGEGE